MNLVELKALASAAFKADSRAPEWTANDEFNYWRTASPETILKLITAIEKMRTALEHTVAMSHSWVITPEHGKVLSDTHREYHDHATNVLADVEALLK